MDRKSFICKSFGLLALGGLLFMGCASDKKNKKNRKYKIIAKNCDGCGHCFKACEERAISYKGKIAEIDQSKCKGCGDCEEHCKKMAIVPIEIN